MTITAMELIEELKKLDPRAPIYVSFETGIANVTGFKQFPNPTIETDYEQPKRNIWNRGD
jgi:hypothetical protein